MLVIFSGLPGTGKTTVSKALAKELGGCVLSTDEIRKGAIEKPGYTKRRKRRVYEEMFRMARESLAKSENVILDATFFKKKLRDDALTIGRKGEACVFFVEIICPDRLSKNTSAMEKN